MSTKNLHSIAHCFLTFPDIDEITLDYSYEEIFLFVRALWSNGVLKDESTLGYLKELKGFANEVNEADQFPTEADQFIFMLEGSEK